MNKTLYIIDGSAVAHRYYHAYQNKEYRNEKGESINMIVGFVKNVMDMIFFNKPDYLVLGYDAKGKNFRDDMFPDYKGTRPSRPADFKRQEKVLPELAKVLDIPWMAIKGVEADDSICSLAHQMVDKYSDLEVIMVTPDKDYKQALRERVTMLFSKKGVWQRYGFISLRQELGLGPRQFIDYLAIVGDTADNIKGINGIGPAGAKRLLNQWGTLTEIYANLEDINIKQREMLIRDEDQVKLAKRLIEIKLDVPIDFDLTDMNIQEKVKIRKANIQDWLNKMKIPIDLIRMR